MHTGHNSVRRLLTLHAYLIFQSKGLPDVSGNRFFLELQKERKSSKKARRKKNYPLYMDENVTSDR